jgi:glycosyltransferase involved in cell wall biosynthesis
MRIIVANIRYFLSGGPERYMFNIMEALEEKGHDVIPFSVKHNLNKPSKYSPYFLEPIGDGEEIYFKNYKKNNLKDIIRIIGRLFYSFEAKRKLSRLIGDVKPDLIYILYFENKMSPSIINAAKKSNVPVVVRISDFGMICADNIFYLYDKQKICEKCLSKGKKHLIFNKCFHKSLPYSLLKYFSYILHDIMRIYENVDAFVIPSKFTIGKFIEYGIQEKKILHIPTFFNLINETDSIEYGDFALYFGRIDPDKGIKILVDAFVGLNYKLKIIGFSSSNYDELIIDYLKGKSHEISFLGRMSFEDIIPYLQKCCFTILSSEIYDNFPNTILESFAFKKAVIATDIGSLKEMVENEKTGLLFEYRNSSDLRNKVKKLFSDKEKAKRLGENGFTKLKNDFSKEDHINKLINLFENLR